MRKFWGILTFITALLVSGVQAFAAVPDDYEAYFTFDGTLADETGNYTATAVGLYFSETDKAEADWTYEEGVVGEAIRINDTKDFVGLSTGVNLAKTSYTVSFHARAYSTASTTPILWIGRQDQEVESWNGFWNGFSGPAWTADSVGLSSNDEWGSRIGIAPTETLNEVTGETFGWTMITWSVDVEDNYTTALYYDGTLVGQTSGLAALYDDAIAYLGVNYWDYPADYAVDDLYIYTRVLSDAEVASLAEAASVLSTESGDGSGSVSDSDGAADTSSDDEGEEPWMTNRQAVILFISLLVLGVLVFLAYRFHAHQKEKKRVAWLYGSNEPEDEGAKEDRTYWGNGLSWDGDTGAESTAEKEAASDSESIPDRGETSDSGKELGRESSADGEWNPGRESSADGEWSLGGESSADREWNPGGESSAGGNQNSKREESSDTENELKKEKKPGGENRKKMPLSLKIFLSVLIVIGVFAAGTGVSLLQNYFTEQAIQKAATGLSSGSTTGIVFDATYAENGVPLSVSLEGIRGEITSCLWYVGSKAVGNGLSYTPTEDDLEKIISVRAEVSLTDGGTKTYTNSLYCSKLPVVNLTVDSAIGEEYVAGTATFGGSADYPDEDTELYSGGISIKLRGNSTKYRAKQPYKIKLDSKADLYGMGENKHWVLLANDIDHTQIRNMLVNDFSAALGMESMSSVLVTLFLNGEYVGVYQLCEQIRVDETRVDIFDWDALAGDAAEAIILSEMGANGEAMASGEVEISSDVQDLIDALEVMLTADYSWITEPWEITYEGKTYTVSDYVDIPDATGGFLLEMDFYALGSVSPAQITTAFSQPFYFSKPDNLYTNSEIREYAANYIQSFEYALHSDDYFFRNSDTHYEGYSVGRNSEGGWKTGSREAEYTDDENDGKHYTELFDLDSLVQNFFVCEFSMNWDCMKNSVFITKDVDSLAKISPVWDFDWAFGNYNMYWIDTWYPESWQTTNEYFTTEQYYQSVQWNRYLIKDPYFLLQIYDRYDEVSALMDELLADGGTLDQYEELLAEACAANDAKWSYTYSEYGGETYEDAMDSLREFITIRAAWLDEQFESFETLRLSLGAYEISDRLAVSFVLREDGSEVTIYTDTSDLVREGTSDTDLSEDDSLQGDSSEDNSLQEDSSENDSLQGDSLGDDGSGDSEETWEAWQGARSGSVGESGEDEESEEKEETYEGTVTITACVSDSAMVQVSFQVNGTWIQCADVDGSGYATVTVPVDVLAEEGHNMVQIRGVDAEGNYVKPEPDETDPDSTDPYSNYSIF